MDYYLDRVVDGLAKQMPTPYNSRLYYLELLSSDNLVWQLYATEHEHLVDC